MSTKVTDNVHTGAEYNTNRYVTAKGIAANVRAQIKTAVKAGDLPADLKYKVRSERFAGGQAVSIHLVGAGGDDEAWAMRPVEAGRQEDAAAIDHGVTRVFTDEAKRIAGLVRSFGKRFTREDIDTMQDYFNVSCYVTVYLGEGGRCI